MIRTSSLLYHKHFRKIALPFWQTLGSSEHVPLSPVARCIQKIPRTGCLFRPSGRQLTFKQVKKGRYSHGQAATGQRLHLQVPKIQYLVT